MSTGGTSEIMTMFDPILEAPVLTGLMIVTVVILVWGFVYCRHRSSIRDLRRELEEREQRLKKFDRF